MITGFWRESHPPEVIQRFERFDAGFPEFAVLLVLHPGDAKFGGLLRKTVGELHFRSDSQSPGRPDHRSQNADDAGMRGFLQRIPIRSGTTYFYRDPHHYARALPLIFELRCIDQPVNQF
jgi:hypothetical protein